ncbi:zinc finger protein ZOP1-like [Chenopodium quinoa]|uniref:zinc finger protein ZOP1-like n=1 Tax=Chenopodium quinoa TaxID=63459 RepID=UPI000B772011|nr:zinc finger protein ZOP1-like [Chenopodium quinoa]XP_021773489.1 zinc finger protein ZOP1-like [Chenopodium quinoa]
MTEYWVSQGKHWCDFCKIFITNNPSTIRNHEMGQRHKDSVSKRLVDMRKEKAAKEKQEKEDARTLQQIEAKATRSYQKDIASQESKQSQAPADFLARDTAWEYNSATGYYYDQHTGIQYDPKSGFYYSDDLGNWVTQEEAFAAAKKSAGTKQKVPLKKPLAASTSGQPVEKKEGAPRPVVSGSINPTRSVKGAQSSLAVGKRKRPEKPKAVSAEEVAALRAREAARKRVEDREKNMLGLYGH